MGSFPPCLPIENQQGFSVNPPHLTNLWNCRALKTTPFPIISPSARTCPEGPLVPNKKNERPLFTPKSHPREVPRDPLGWRKQTVDGRNPFRTAWTRWLNPEFIGIYQGIIIPGILRGCWILSIHGISS